jgi:DNA-binding transcriptional MerR regulator
MIDRKDSPERIVKECFEAQTAPLYHAPVPTPDPELRIGELSRRSMISVRNIREYQDRGLLPPPRREGRVAYYSDDHLTRLELISHLLARGYTLVTIRDLFEAWETGRDLCAVLGLKSTVHNRWPIDDTVRTTDTELFEFTGHRLTEEGLRLLIDAGVITVEGDGLWISREVRRAVVELSDAGVPVESSVVLFSRSRARLTEVANDMVSVVFDALLPEGIPARSPEGEDPDQLTGSARRLIPVAEEAIRILFGEALRHALGGAAAVTAGALDTKDRKTIPTE